MATEFTVTFQGGVGGVDNAVTKAQQDVTSLAARVAGVVSEADRLASAFAGVSQELRTQIALVERYGQALDRVHAAERRNGSHPQSQGGGDAAHGGPSLDGLDSVVGGLGSLASSASRGSRFARLSPALGRLSAGLEVGAGASQIISSVIRGPVGGTLGAAATGAGIGVAAGPWGALAGGAIGAGLGALGGGNPAAGIQRVAAAVATAAGKAKDAIRDWVRSSGIDLRQVEQAFHNVADVVQTVFGAAFKAAEAVVKSVLPGIRQTIKGTLDEIAGVVRVFSGLLTGNFGGAWRGVKQIFGGALEELLGAVRAWTAPFREGFSAAWKTIPRALESFAKTILDDFIQLGKDIIDAIVQGIESAPGKIKDALMKLVPGPVRSALNIFRGGGTVPGFAAGGLVPALVSPGEQVLFGNAAWTVPGAREPRDSVFAMLPAGAAVLTDHGQQLAASGMSLDAVLANQAPHFARGGWVRVGGTTYNDPPPGAFGGDLRGFAELGTATRGGIGTGRGWLACAFGLSGELPANAAVDFMRDGHVVTLRKRDRGYGQGGDGNSSDPFYAADFWDGVGAPIGIGQGWKGSLLARLHQPGAARRAAPRRAAPHAGHATAAPMSEADAFELGFEAGERGSQHIFFSGGHETSLFRKLVATPRATPGSTARGSHPSAGTPPAVANAIRAANAIDAHHYPYESPGDRTASLKGPMDCSGAVSKVLIAAGLMHGSVEASPYFKGSWGAPGPGRWITTYSRGGYGATGHVFMRIGDRYFGTSAQNPGGGAGWLDHFPGGSGWVLSHAPRLRGGGIVQAFRGGGTTRHAPAPAHPPRNTTEAHQADAHRAAPHRAAPHRAAAHRAALHRTLRGIAHAIDDTSHVSNRHLSKLHSHLQHAVRALRRSRARGHGRKARQLGTVMDLVDAEMGKRAGLAVSSARKVLDAVTRRQAATAHALVMNGTDPSSIAGLSATLADDATSLRDLTAQQAALNSALEQARRFRDKRAISAITQELSDVGDAISGLQEDQATHGRELAHLQRYQPNDVALAMAALTPGTDDDRKALQDRENLLTDDLAHASSPEEQIELANELKGVRDQLDSLDGTIQQQNQLAQQRMDLDRELAENQRRMLAVAESQPNVLLGGLIAAINGGIGGRVGLGFQIPSYAGQGVRY